jgi:hypothetical protein
MLQVSDGFKRAMVAPVRKFEAVADFRLNEDNPSEVKRFTHEDKIKNLEIQRVGDNSKFFGYGICHRLNIHLVDLEDAITPLPNSAIKVDLGIWLEDGSTEFITYPTFYLSEKHREEEEGEISLTAYDKLDEATTISIDKLVLEPPYTINDFITICANYLGLKGVVYEGLPANDYTLTLVYEDGANFAGTESIREGLNAAAEATQTIYYIDNENKLHFKRLDIDGDAVATITEEDYYTLTHSSNRRLTEIMHVTELGDNVSAKLDVSGTTQYIRNNPFWDMREDIADLVDNALANMGGLTINQFDCSWRGNLPLEIGDKIDLKQVCLDNCVESGYVLDDVISYDGGYQHKTQWSYSNTSAETHANASSIGEAINQTIAKVDKVKQEITILSSTVDENNSAISSIIINTDSINQSVEKIEQSVKDSLDGVNKEIETIKENAKLNITEEDVKILIGKEIESGSGKVKTETGYTFDGEGLTISKDGSEISTQITEDGMTISRNGEDLLTADNTGVYAANLHATTYLIIGKYSRFEDYERDGEPRTGCFWIGG